MFDSLLIFPFKARRVTYIVQSKACIGAQLSQERRDQERLGIRLLRLIGICAHAQAKCPPTRVPLSSFFLKQAIATTILSSSPLVKVLQRLPSFHTATNLLTVDHSSFNRLLLPSPYRLQPHICHSSYFTSLPSKIQGSDFFSPLLYQSSFTFFSF